jgi:hypothetical protein
LSVPCSSNCSLALFRLPYGRWKTDYPRITQIRTAQSDVVALRDRKYKRPEVQKTEVQKTGTVLPVYFLI